MYQAFFVFIKPFGVLAFVLNLIKNQYKVAYYSTKFKKAYTITSQITRFNYDLHVLRLIYTIVMCKLIFVENSSILIGIIKSIIIGIYSLYIYWNQLYNTIGGNDYDTW
jgi:hypothetical protein